ncbi:hypothetical protein NUW58_g7005 [Xylaria curta]|uniref:Uncharacterized protein n=1 Tax=Xylaria curta TaxID=42375 RepID=A0ACC1NMB8_9PEZI|nr:hypothetical protein NUW58_g7005 [Xylaria curta]
MSRQGVASKKRVPEDFHYMRFRNQVNSDLNINQLATLYTPNFGLIDINNENSFIDCLVRAQNGDAVVRLHPILKLRYITLSARTFTPEPTQEGNEPVGLGEAEPQDLIADSKPDDQEGDDEGDENPNQGPPEVVDDDFEGEEDSALFENLAPPPETNDDEWEEICKFFNCPIDSRKIAVLGLSFNLHDYQAAAVWRIFRQVAHHEIPSFMVADSPGLGKTGMSLATAAIFAMLHRTYREVQKERQLGAGNQLRHVRLGQPGPCPTQGQRILCPCIYNGLSHRLVQVLADFPTVVCCPPGLMGQWYEEAKRWLDDNPNSPACGIKVFQHHNAAPEERQLQRSEIAGIRGVEVLRGQEHYGLQAQAGSSANIIIISVDNTPRFRARFDKDVPIPPGSKPPKRRRLGENKPRRGRNKLVKINTLGCSFVFFDECHNYRGVSGALTRPFEMLQGVSRMTDTVMAVGLSASLTLGPGYWHPFVRHALDHAGREGSVRRGRGGEGRNHNPRPVKRISGLGSLQDLSRQATNFSYLVDNMNRAQVDANMKAEMERRRDELGRFCGVFCPQMMIARKKTTKFRGQAIGARGRAVTYVRLNMPKGETYDIFKSLVDSIGTYINQQYEDAVRAWESSGSEGEKPSKKTIVNNRLQQIAGNPARERNFEVISRASCFPRIAFLVQRGLIQREQLLFADIRPLAIEINQLLHPDLLDNVDFTAVQRVLERSPFYNYRQEILDQSPKLHWVRRKIDGLLAIRTKPPTDPEVLKDHGPAPPDGTNTRHALILSETPLSSWLCFLILWRLYRRAIPRGEIIILYAHSEISPIVRTQYTAYMQESCQYDNRCKILVSTSDLFSEGHNLQRVNTAILTEFPSSHEKQRQAFGRVDRQGQTMNTFLYQLYDGANLAEQVKQHRFENRRRLAEQTQGDNDNDNDGVDLQPLLALTE